MVSDPRYGGAASEPEVKIDISLRTFAWVPAEEGARERRLVDPTVRIIRSKSSLDGRWLKGALRLGQDTHANTVRTAVAVEEVGAARSLPVRWGSLRF